VLCLLGLWACAAGPRAGERGYPFNVEGRYEGRMHLNDRPFEALLTLSTASGGRVSGTLRVRDRISIDGRVTGVIADDLLRITITYASPEGCDGRMEGILTIEEGGASIDGPVAVRDCAEPFSGRLAFRRSTSGTDQPDTATGDPPFRAER
jgi:hypothetical protein